MSRIQYAVIPADQTKPIEFKEAEMDLPLLQEETGGYIEHVVLSDKIELFCDEEGKLKDLDPNHRATFLAVSHRRLREGDYLAGDVVVVGPTVDGESTDLLPESADLLRTIDELPR